MVRTTKKRVLRTVACISVLLAVGYGLAGCGKSKPKPDESGASSESPNDVSPVMGLAPVTPAPVEPVVVPYEPSPTLQNIIKAAETWDPCFQTSWGKIAPDFTLSDVEGKVHTLSGYRGGNVLVVIWRTWNSTCKLEIPHLKELRTMYPPESLAILAISDEPADSLAQFVGQNGINYTVVSSAGVSLDLFDQVEYAPTSFFIGPEGKIKLAAMGVIPTTDAAAIINAP